MKDPSSIFAEINGGPWPTWAGKNASGAGNTDGTAFIAAMIDDYMFGWVQHILYKAGLSPNGVTESYTASQIMDALYLILGPPGTICEWNLVNDPASYGARFLLLNGQGIIRANYTALDTNVYVGNANNATAAAYYHADDSGGVTRNTAGVYLILPESRGYTTRGLDVAASVDPDGASRTVGSLQSKALQGHYHNINSYTDTTAGGATRYAIVTRDISTAGTGQITGAFATAIITGVHGAVSVSTETRMANRATKFAIRY